MTQITLPTVATPITRQNVDAILDAGQLYAAIKNGKWYRLRRNGQTKRWKRDKSRIHVPFKYGLYGYGQITENDFTVLRPFQDHDNAANDLLCSDHYRHADDIPAELKPS